MSAVVVHTHTSTRDYVGCFRRQHLLYGGATLVFAVLLFGFASVLSTTYTVESQQNGAGAALLPPLAAHQKTPQPVKAIYMTACVVGTPIRRAQLVKLIDETELNSIVIDIKDYSGYLSFKPEDPTLLPLVSKQCMAPDMKEFLTSLHEKGVYVIGRITVFQDPVLTKARPDLAVKKKSDGTTWKDYKGLSFTDPGSKEVWDYIVAIAQESYRIGFDELNFDYIRFPSDGPMNDITFDWSGTRVKSVVLEDFFIYLHDKLKPTQPPPKATAGEAGWVPIISADLFGMTTTNYDDLNIGQVIEKAAPHFDYISPMVYPSHYPPKFLGMDNPNHYPYEVVKYSMDGAVKRFLATTTKVALRGAEPLSTTTKPFLYPKEPWEKLKLRPWLQDFDYGGDYDIAEVKAQIQAVYDSGLTSWMLWAPSNVYTRAALLPE